MSLYIIKAIKKSASRGFTLIEMLVAITAFTLIIGSATGLFVAAVRSQVKALATQKLLDETSYVMEYMSRAIRMAKKQKPSPPYCIFTGFNYEIPIVRRIDGDPKLGTAVKFINYNDECMEFVEIGTLLYRKISSEDYTELTSGDLEITDIKFKLSGAEQPSTDENQPRVTILMTVKKAGAAGPKIRIQTTISQRNLDVRQ